jgi:hypothetical protein
VLGFLLVAVLHASGVLDKTEAMVGTFAFMLTYFGVTIIACLRAIERRMTHAKTEADEHEVA